MAKRGRKKKEVLQGSGGFSEPNPGGDGEPLDEVISAKPISKEELIEEIKKSLTKEELAQLIREIDPNCGRGGCLHLKSNHYAGTLPDECHLCSCRAFVK